MWVPTGKDKGIDGKRLAYAGWGHSRQDSLKEDARSKVGRRVGA